MKAHGAYTTTMKALKQVQHCIKMIRGNLKTMYAAGPLIEDAETIRQLIELRDLVAGTLNAFEDAADKSADAAYTHAQAQIQDGITPVGTITRYVRCRTKT